jgi:Spy/CpxP family protein refolding chaperone
MAKTWQIILATVAIFVAGLVTGGATALGVVDWIRTHRAANAPLNPFGPHPGQVQQINPQLIRNFALQLDLTKEQRAKIGPIMRRAARLMTEEISDVLTPEQRVKFEELIREQRERIQQFRQAQQQAQGQAVAAPAESAASPPTK